MLWTLSFTNVLRASSISFPYSPYWACFYLEKMKNFATKNNFQFTEEKNDGIPYFTIFTNSDINETLKLAKQIQSEVFGNNNNNTEYEIVP